MSKKSYFDTHPTSNIIIQLTPKDDNINNEQIIKHHRGGSMTNISNNEANDVINSPIYNNKNKLQDEQEEEIQITKGAYNFDNIDMNGPPPVSKRQMANSPPVGKSNNNINNDNNNKFSNINTSDSNNEEILNVEFTKPVKTLPKKFSTKSKVVANIEPVVANNEPADTTEEPIPPKASYNFDDMDIYGAPPSSNRKMVSSPVLPLNNSNPIEPIKDIVKPVPIKKVTKPTVSKKIVKEEPIELNEEEPVPPKASYNFSDVDMYAAPPPSRKQMTSSPILANKTNASEVENTKVVVEMKPFDNDSENIVPPKGSYNLDNMDLNRPPPTSSRQMNSSPVLNSSKGVSSSSNGILKYLN